MKLNDLHSLQPDVESLAISERKGPAPGGKKGKIRNKEDIGKRKNENTAFARAIRATGKEQQELAKAAGIDPSSISRYKKQVRVPSHETLSNLVDVLGLQPGDMFPELEV